LMEAICRVCLKGNDSMVEIFDSKLDLKTSISKILSTVTDFPIAEEDSYPKIICTPCLEEAQNAFETVQTSKSSHQFYCQAKQFGFDSAKMSENLRKSDNQNFKDAFQCPHCPKRCKLRGNLLKHIRLHSGERPYKCESCQSSFKDKTTLKQHSRIHTGERPYQCSECSQSFPYSSSLRDHMLGHSGSRPYKCTECSSTFRWQKLLKIHIRSHTG
ncbi:hypothetical protein KR067_004474, partial [Drosophila pandora]